MNLTYEETLELISFLERTFTIRKYGARFYRERIEFLMWLKEMEEGMYKTVIDKIKKEKENESF